MGKGTENVSELAETRTWKALEEINKGLSALKEQMTDIIRLEERMNSQEITIQRHGKKIEVLDDRVRDNELWQAKHGDKASVERMIANLQEELDALKKTKNINLGEKEVNNKVVAWVLTVASALFIYFLTK